MPTEDPIIKTVYEAIDEINVQMVDEMKLEKTLDTALIGSSGNLDSLGLLNLIVAIEEKVEKNMGILIILADERSMAKKDNPFETIQSLVAYTKELIGETK